jgi:hypothetical protein
VEISSISKTCLGPTRISATDNTCVSMLELLSVELTLIDTQAQCRHGPIDTCGCHTLPLAARDTAHHGIADDSVSSALQAKQLDDEFHPAAMHSMSAQQVGCNMYVKLAHGHLRHISAPDSRVAHLLQELMQLSSFLVQCVPRITAAIRV